MREGEVDYHSHDTVCHAACRKPVNVAKILWRAWCQRCRYANHDQSLQLEDKLKEVVKRKMEQIQETVGLQFSRELHYYVTTNVIASALFVSGLIWCDLSTFSHGSLVRLTCSALCCPTFYIKVAAIAHYGKVSVAHQSQGLSRCNIAV